MIDRFLGGSVCVFFCPFWSTVLQCVHGCRYTPEATDRVVSVACFLTGVCSSVTLLMVDLWQYCVCCIRAGVTRCTLSMAVRICASADYMHAVLWSHIGILMRLLAAEPRSTTGLLFTSLWPVERSVFDGVGLAGFKSRADAYLFALAALSFFVFYSIFPLFFLFIGF